MKKLKFLLGGQPFRSTDWKVLQDHMIGSIKAMMDTITSNNAIVAGLTTDYTEDGPEVVGTEFTVAAGYFWDSSEICRVDEFTFTKIASASLYLRKSVIDSSQRTVNGVQQYVMTETVYTLVHTAAPQAGDIAFMALPRLSVMNDEGYRIVNLNKTKALNAGFTPVGMDGLECYQNAYGDSVIRVVFTVTVGTGGAICTLPAEMKPKHDTFGFYRTNNTLSLLVLRTTGIVEVFTPSTAGNNIIEFKFNVNFEN